MKLTDVIRVWDIVHTHDTGSLGFSDLEAALDDVVGVENDVPSEQPTAPPETVDLPSTSHPQSGEPLDVQIDRLAKFILREIPGEPSQNQGAIDTAIRLLADAIRRADQAESDAAVLRRALEQIDLAQLSYEQRKIVVAALPGDAGRALIEELEEARTQRDALSTAVEVEQRQLRKNDAKKDAVMEVIRQHRCPRWEKHDCCTLLTRLAERHNTEGS